MAPVGRQPSQVSIGKKPMAYTSAANGGGTGAGATKGKGKGKVPPPTHPHPNGGPQRDATKDKEKAKKIWSTSSTEERERIKEFWLGLSVDERRGLVKVEKEAVLRKMKEQQRHSCGCAVCGRKRNAIEEELEVLYDAYYEELEQYAHYQQRYVSSGGTIPPPPGPGPFPGAWS
ncbi:hypothetical protein BDZ89DRAFT_481142 [Hymenopellis radicata]|nr:hypothetical protein BDZ89DRAFT_481142 [Hymenopellis radicata]